MDVNFTPQVVNLTTYAGDTLEVELKVPTGYIAGREWSAQVRDTRTGSVAATFTATPGGTEDDPVLLSLSGAETAALITGGATKYEGVWDVQLAPAGGGDPTVSVVQGTFVVALDVTR